MGIPTLPYEKKERLVTDEARSKEIDATSRSIIWYDTLKDSFELANEFLGLTGEDKLKVTLRYSIEETNEEGGPEDVARKDNPMWNG